MSTYSTDQSNLVIPRQASFLFQIRNAVRSSNTLSLGSGKTNCVLGFSANRVWLVVVIYLYVITKRERSQYQRLTPYNYLFCRG